MTEPQIAHPVQLARLSTRNQGTTEDLRIRDLGAGPADKVEIYLQRTEKTYEVGEPEYYGRLALKQALAACREGNYGIGAVAILIHDGIVEEFHNRNAMLTGVGVTDHAESRVLVDAVRWRIANLDQRQIDHAEALRSALVNPVTRYTTDSTASMTSLAERLGNGIHVFGSLEPCQMCVAQIFNSGSKSSWSIAEDEFGGALLNGKFDRLPPIFPTLIRQAGQRFGFISDGDPDLVALSNEIFLHSRQLIDGHLAARSKKE